MPISGVNSDTIAQLKANVLTGKPATYQIQAKGRQYYVSMSTLQCNNWHVVNFLRSADITLDSSGVIKSILASRPAVDPADRVQRHLHFLAPAAAEKTAGYGRKALHHPGAILRHAAL